MSSSECKAARFTLLLVPAALLLLGGAAADAQEKDAGLPGGATSLSERHGDWTVACAVQQGEGKTVKACAMSQQQANNQGQTVLSIELRPSGDGVSGLLVLPFGVAVTSSVALAVDEVDQNKKLTFSTCVPAGCLVPLAFDAKLLATLRSGKALAIATPTADGGNISLRISLSGFDGAFKRVAELLR